MIPPDAIVNRESNKEPEMRWGTLYALLRIAEDPQVQCVRWQPPMTPYAGAPWSKLWDVQTLSLNALIKKAMPFFDEIEKLYRKNSELSQRLSDAQCRLVETTRINNDLRARLDRVGKVASGEE